jgi:methyl-accepting chemotaxis protein
MLLLSAVSYRSLFQVEDKLSLVVEKLQPTMLASQDLSQALTHATAALGLYLLAQDNGAKVEYQQALGRIDTALAQLKERLEANHDEASSDTLKSLEDLVGRFKSYEPRMVKLVDDPMSNVAGLSFAAERINPTSQQMLQLTGEMLMSEFEEDANRTRRELLNQIHELRYNWANVMNGVRAYIAFRGQRSLDEINLYLGAVKETADKLAAREDELTFEQAEGLKQFVKRKEQFEGEFAELRKIEATGKWRTDIHLIRTEVRPLLADIDKLLHALVETQRAQAVDTSGALLSDLHSDARTMGVLLVIGLIVGLLVAWLAGNQIATPILRLKEILEGMARGEGDLTQRVQLATGDELGQASDYFNQMMAGLQEMVVDIADVSQQLAQGTEQTSDRVAAVRANVAEGAERTRETAAATEEMSATSAEIANNAETAAGEAVQARSQADAGNGAMRAMAEKTRTMVQQIGQLQQNVDAIEEKGRSMHQMIGAINEIAEQTNLLALNAAIEAARAGEQGRGFAVVADEVRTLASRTQQSTQEIQDMILRLQSGAGNAVKVMEGAQKKAQESSDLVEKAAESLAMIAGSISAINDMNTMIASAAEEQSAVAGEMQSNMNNIREVADRSADGAQQTAQASEELARLAAEQQALMGQFRV